MATRMRPLRSCASAQEKIAGVVSFWNTDRRYGFLRRDDGERDAFCHIGQVVDDVDRLNADRELEAKQDGREDKPRRRQDGDEQTELRRTLRFVPSDRAIQRALRHLEVPCVHDQPERHHESREGRKRHEDRRTLSNSKYLRQKTENG